MAVIYRITNMANNHYYVGSAESFARREWQHKYALKRNEHKNPRLQAAWNKYGSEMFVFEVIEEVPEGRTAFDIENTYLMRCVGELDCYNINTDAYVPRLGVPHTEESKEKMRRATQLVLSESRGGKFIPTVETRARMSAAAKGNQNALGYKRTDAEREAIRQRTMGNQNFAGKQHTEETKGKLRRPLRAVLPDGTVREFVGVSAAGAALGVPYPMLVRSTKSGMPVQKGRLAGWFFSYADEASRAPSIPEEYIHYPRSRSQAKAESAKQYFTGVPCARGHIGPRAVKGACIFCRRGDEKAARTKPVDTPPTT